MSVPETFPYRTAEQHAMQRPPETILSTEGLTLSHLRAPMGLAGSNSFVPKERGSYMDTTRKQREKDREATNL